MSSDARDEERVSITREYRWDTFNLQRHDNVFQGGEYVVADASRLIDTAREDLHTAEKWKRISSYNRSTDNI